ncbi:MAG: zinc ribbon domain-containing protein [Nitrospirota bacterium]
MTTVFETDTVLCPHCGTELIDDDELCKFCGKAIVATGAAQRASSLVRAGLRSLKAKIRPMTGEELDAQKKSLVILDHTNPANPIWDD